MWSWETRGAVRVACVLGMILGLLTVVSGCGGGGASGASSEDTVESTIPNSPPSLAVPARLPPRKLVVRDLFKGTGTEAHKGDEVNLKYYCILWEGGPYASSWNYPRPPTFELGNHRLLRGFNLAVPGMKEGGGRKVLIPSSMVFYPDVSHPPLGRLAAVICKVYLVNVHGSS
jgi:peptidylprolyl isomerase